MYVRSVAGLSWEFHHVCQQRMNQDGHLKHIFSMLVSLLVASQDALRQQSASGAAAFNSDGPFGWLESCIAVINTIFGWDFSDSESKVCVGRSKVLVAVNVWALLAVYVWAPLAVYVWAPLAVYVWALLPVNVCLIALAMRTHTHTCTLTNTRTHAHQ